MTPEDAEEYTQALGQVVAGGWRQVALGRRLGVPQALGLTTAQWVESRLGGYVRYALTERREAVRQLLAPIEDGGMGLKTREAAEVLGVNHSTVVRDNAGANAPVSLFEPDAEPPDGGAAAPPSGGNGPSRSHAEGWAERREAVVRETEQRVAALPLEERFDRIEQLDALRYLGTLPECCADLCVTSPPYWAKRTYDGEHPDELGQEPDPQTYVEGLRRIIGQIGRVLAPTGWLFLNLGDTYASNPGGYRGDPERWRGISDQARRVGSTAPADRRYDVPGKSLCLVPWRLLTVLVQHEGWRCRNIICWHKPNHLPENVGDRLTQAWEPVFALTRSETPYFDRGSREGDVWAIGAGGDATAQGLEHAAPFPRRLVERIVGHACPPGGVVLDPFAGSGTVLRVATAAGRRFLGCDLLVRSQGLVP